eukprot:6427737-Amphidinium_carterae.1
MWLESTMVLHVNIYRNATRNTSISKRRLRIVDGYCNTLCPHASQTDTNNKYRGRPHGLATDVKAASNPPPSIWIPRAGT